MERRDASVAGAARRRALAGAAVVLALALAGCGAGNDAQTSQMTAAVGGVDADAGSIAMRNMQIDFGEEGFYREGGAAPLRIWMSNDGKEPVFLESVTSPDAETVTLATETAETVESPEESASSSEDAGESEPADESASPSEDASESASPEDEETSAALIGEPGFSIEVPAGDFVRLAPTTGSFLLLEGLGRVVTMATEIEVVFDFSNGEEVSVVLPMSGPENPRPRAYFGDPAEPAAEG